MPTPDPDQELVPLHLYHALEFVAQLSRRQSGQVVDGIRDLRALLRARGAADMSAQQAVDAGLITRDEYYTAFGVETPH
jgi:hypothetical protein